MTAGIARISGPLAAAGRLVAGRAPRAGAVVLCYHDVVERGPASDPLMVSVGQLRSQLRLVSRLGFSFVSLSELTERVVAGRPVAGLAALTFDDALVGVHHHAVPVLAQLSVPATLLAVSAEWGRRPRWWPDAARTMTRAELAESIDAGLTLAAHTRTHPSLPGLSAARLRDEISGSRTDLEDVAGAAVDVFAYPFGHHNAAVRAAVAEAGYVAAYTFLNGRVTGAEDRLRLPRFTMGRHHSGARLAYHLARSAGSWPDTQLGAVCPTTHRGAAEAL